MLIRIEQNWDANPGLRAILASAFLFPKGLYLHPEPAPMQKKPNVKLKETINSNENYALDEETVLIRIVLLLLNLISYKPESDYAIE